MAISYALLQVRWACAARCVTDRTCAKGQTSAAGLPHSYEDRPVSESLPKDDFQSLVLVLLAVSDWCWRMTTRWKHTLDVGASLISFQRTVAEAMDALVDSADTLMEGVTFEELFIHVSVAFRLCENRRRIRV